VCVAGKKLAGGWTPTGKQPNPLQPPDKKVRGVGLGQEVCTPPKNQGQSGSRVTVVPGRVGSRVSVTDPVPSLPRTLVNCIGLSAIPLKFMGLFLTVYGHSLKPLHRNTVIGTQAGDGWTVTFGTARRGLGGLWIRSVPSSL